MDGAFLDSGRISPHLKEWLSPEVAVAGETLLALASAFAKTPHLSVSDDGELVLNWIRPGGRMEASIDPDLHLVWVFDLQPGTPTGTIAAGQDVDLAERPLGLPGTHPFLSDLESFLQGGGPAA